jgi:hypothetical protein
VERIQLVARANHQWIGGVREAAVLFRVWMACAAVAELHGQDLTPRAYVLTPTGSHAIILSTSFNAGEVVVDPAAPIDNAKGSFQVPALGYYESFNFLGRSANITAIVPYARGNFSADIEGVSTHAYRSGMADARVRIAVNLYGGPAMDLGEYLRWKEKRLIGVSLTVAIPTGQYDSARAVNTGTNRWGIKPEIGFTRRWAHWVFDGYAGVWAFGNNTAYFPGYRTRTQKPIGAVESHFGYYVRPRLWISADANFWIGSRSAIDGIERQDQQRDSRAGLTTSIPVSRNHAAKLSYSRGAYVTRSGAYRTITVGWQYSWMSPK